eukprot:s1331_g15.t1
MAEATKKVCKSCGYSYAEDQGRQHGASFTCTQCRNIESVIRRNLGSTADMAQWTKDETHHFFRAQHKDSGDGRLKWTTIRAAWVKQLTKAVIRKFTATVEKEALPKTVWQKRGWEDAVIDRFEPKWSDEYGTHVHELPIQRLRWEEAFETAERQVLEQEKNAAKKKGGKGTGDQELDVPGQAEKDDTKEEKTKAAEKKKLVSNNAKIAALAARAMGSLCAGEAALGKLLAKSEKLDHVNTAAQKVCQDSLETMQRWGAAARAAVNAQEANKGLAEDVDPVALASLPFDQADLKVALQQSAAGQKDLKESMPKKEPKAKAKAKADPGSARPSEGDNGEPKPKRRRTKSS